MTCLTFCQVKVNTARFLPQSDSGVISEVNLLCHACSNRKGLEGKNVHMNDFYILPYARNNSSRTRVPSIQFQKTTPAVLCNTVLVFFKEKSAVSYSLRTPGSRSSSMPPLSHEEYFSVRETRLASLTQRATLSSQKCLAKPQDTGQQHQP